MTDRQTKRLGHRETTFPTTHKHKTDKPVDYEKNSNVLEHHVSRLPWMNVRPNLEFYVNNKKAKHKVNKFSEESNV